MKRETRLGALVFLLTTPLMFPQELQNRPSPVPPSEILRVQLIAWSQLQKPQPMSQSATSDAAQQSAQSVDTPSQERPQPPAAQTLTGTIMKDGNRYVLKVSSNTTYDLEDQERARKYEGKQVKVAGVLDPKGNSLHIITIELIS